MWTRLMVLGLLNGRNEEKDLLREAPRELKKWANETPPRFEVGNIHKVDGYTPKEKGACDDKEAMQGVSHKDTKEINGVPTELIIMNFSDRIFVVISQIDKFGTMISARIEDDSRPGCKPSFEVNVLLGRRDDPLLTIYARQLIEASSKSSSRPLLLSIALKERDPATFDQILKWVVPLLS